MLINETSEQNSNGYFNVDFVFTDQTNACFICGIKVTLGVRNLYLFLKYIPSDLKSPSSLWINMRITRVGTLIVATIYLQLIQNRYMFRSFTLLQCSHQHCVQPVASDVEVVGYL